jgi:hypothetical protein
MKCETNPQHCDLAILSMVGVSVCRVLCTYGCYPGQWWSDGFFVIVFTANEHSFLLSGQVFRPCLRLVRLSLHKLCIFLKNIYMKSYTTKWCNTNVTPYNILNSPSTPRPCVGQINFIKN